MKYIKTFESLSSSGDDYYKKLGVDVNSFISDFKNVSPDETDERYLQWANSRAKGLYRRLKGQSTIELQRVIFVETESDINMGDLGLHWTNYEIDDHHVSIMKDEYVGDIGSKLPFVITATFDVDDIDKNTTIINRTLFEEEDEITIKEGAKPNTFNITKY